MSNALYLLQSLNSELTGLEAAEQRDGKNHFYRDARADACMEIMREFTPEELPPVMVDALCRVSCMSDAQVWADEHDEDEPYSEVDWEIALEVFRETLRGVRTA